MIDTYDQAGWVRNMETYGLRNMIRALSIMELLNTEAVSYTHLRAHET